MVVPVVRLYKTPSPKHILHSWHLLRVNIIFYKAEICDARCFDEWIHMWLLYTPAILGVIPPITLQSLCSIRVSDSAEVEASTINRYA